MRAYQVVDADYVERERGLMPLVDVRPPLLYDAGHIPTALNVRLDVAAASDDPAETLAELFRGEGIFPEDASRASTRRLPATIWRAWATPSCGCTPAA